MAGPVAECPEPWEETEYEQCWDDVNGSFLDPELIRESRNIELNWVKYEKVHSFVPRTV